MWVEFSEPIEKVKREKGKRFLLLIDLRHEVADISIEVFSEFLNCIQI